MCRCLNNKRSKVLWVLADINRCKHGASKGAYVTCMWQVGWPGRGSSWWFCPRATPRGRWSPPAVPQTPAHNLWLRLPMRNNTIKSNYAIKQRSREQLWHHHKVRLWIRNNFSNTDYSLRTRLWVCVWGAGMLLFWACVYVVHLLLRVHSWRLF